MIKDPTKVAITAAPAMEIALAVAATAITAVAIEAKPIVRQGGEASPSLSLYSVGEKGVKLKKRRRTRVSTRKS